MKRAFLVGSVVAGLAVLVGSAAGAGPTPGVIFGSPGVVSHDGKLRYQAMRAGGGTLVAAVTTRGAVARRSRFLKGGAFGIPLVAYDGSTGGLSRNGRRLVVSEPSTGTKTRFVVLDPRTLRVRGRVTLNGTFGFDALSPDGSLMYLIQLKSPPNGSGFAYDVRALDVDTGRLYPGAIVDRREPDEKMTGIPMTRVGSADGGWAYTLYSKQNGGAFVHALHTTHRAFCIDLPLRVAGEQLGRVRMRVGKNALILRLRGKTIAKVDTRTFRVTR